MRTYRWPSCGWLLVKPHYGKKTILDNFLSFVFSLFSFWVYYRQSLWVFPEDLKGGVHPTVRRRELREVTVVSEGWWCPLVFYILSGFLSTHSCCHRGRVILKSMSSLRRYPHVWVCIYKPGKHCFSVMVLHNFSYHEVCFSLTLTWLI